MARQEMELIKVMERYGAIPTDWQHFFGDAAPYIAEKNDSSQSSAMVPCGFYNLGTCRRLGYGG